MGGYDSYGDKEMGSMQAQKSLNDLIRAAEVAMGTCQGLLNQADSSFFSEIVVESTSHFIKELYWISYATASSLLHYYGTRFPWRPRLGPYLAESMNTQTSMNISLETGTCWLAQALTSILLVCSFWEDLQNLIAFANLHREGVMLLCSRLGKSEHSYLDSTAAMLCGSEVNPIAGIAGDSRLVKIRAIIKDHST
ncbi:uncharacterized protein FOMMEDRAFT_161677 [Fomitiporia mediterranea MF3/22]|uniref:uncharacterized protein n=1 Tax=Fomitiporia mediterranea (strain MF3/22) TaxID=694068 RepID=UPI0004408BEF|nr:uncharacterized protein FOMMEDRAFT_161677 [Fomitiporia mediterranea MF3/22]EJC98333.1 hypothetical protein FOMMEDRAFT_161677 [Fomitiporia mediterranea MF3/22]